MASGSPSTGLTKKKADLKVVILGDAGVGKTCLIRRYMDGVFYNDIPNTVGAAFFLKQCNGSNVAIWDTAGEEKFSGLSSFYCRRANAAIVAYDIGSEESFLSIEDRFVKLLESAVDHCTIVLVGTKLDLIDNSRRRQVTRDQAISKAAELSSRWKSLRHPSGDPPVFETSSKTGEGIVDVFDYIFETIVPKKPKELPKLDLQDPPKRVQQHHKCC